MSFETGFWLFFAAFFALGLVGVWFVNRYEIRMNCEAEERRQAMLRFQSSFLRSWFDDAQLR